MTVTVVEGDHRWEMHPPGGKIGDVLRTGVPYERVLLRDMAARMGPGLVVDVGAHVGNHTIYLAVVCGRRVFAAEPVVTDELRANLDMNGLTDAVDVTGYAMSDGEGEARHAGAGRIVTGNGPLKLRRLDHYDLRDVAAVKVDVEGHEPRVLAGAVDLLTRCRPLLWVEAWDAAATERVRAVLTPLGYELTETIRPSPGRTPIDRWEPL